MISCPGLRKHTCPSPQEYLLERPEDLRLDSLLLLGGWRLLSAQTAEAGGIWRREIRRAFGGEVVEMFRAPRRVEEAAC